MRGKRTNKNTGILCYGFTGVALCLIFALGLFMTGCADETYTQSPDMLGPLWVPCVTDGFNHPEDQRSAIGKMAYFKGYLYVGKEWTWTGADYPLPKMYRIYHGDPCSQWEAVVGDGAVMLEGFGNPEWTAQYNGMIVFKDALYVLIENEVWRTYNGTDWQPIIARGGILPAGFGIGAFLMTDPQIFKDMLYVCTVGTTATSTIWRTADGNTWEPVVGAGAATPAGFGLDFANGKICTFNDYLYMIAATTTSYPVFRTDDGIHWEKICDEIAPDGSVWRQPVVFKSQIYVPTWRSGGLELGKIYRSSDGITWEPVYPPGSPYQYWIEVMIVWDDFLFIGTQDWDRGCKIFRSTDGISWTLMAEKGFYTNYTERRNKSVHAMAVFDGQLYAGTSSSRGYQCELWRSDFPASTVHASLNLRTPILGATLIFVIAIILWKLK